MIILIRLKSSIVPVELNYQNKDGVNNDLILVECDKERIYSSYF